MLPRYRLLIVTREITRLSRARVLFSLDQDSTATPVVKTICALKIARERNNLLSRFLN